MPTVFQNAAGVVSGAGTQIQHTTKRVGNQLQVTTNRILPPQQRDEIVKNLRIFAEESPKLAAFLTAQAALAGLPVILFLAFATTTLLVSLVTCLLLGLLASLVFTFFVVGFALIFVVPTVFIASCSATFIFIWGLVGYTILRRLNGGEAPAKRGTRVGDKLHGLTDGRLALRISGATSQGQDNKAMDAGTTSTANGHVGLNGNEDHRSTSRKENGDYVNGENNNQTPIEWERKWDDGVQQQPVLLETGNTYEVLKVETPVS